jgi:peptidyl-dipeptidase Dcp
MAKDPQLALDLMLAVWKPAKAQFQADVLEAQAIADQEGADFKLAPWDYRYYAEKLRKAKYDLDFSVVKPYLQLEHIREAMFWAAKELYGFTFVKVDGLTVFNPDMSVYEVKRGEAHVGLWYFDPYARAGKQSGAWMNAYRDQQAIDGPITTIVSNNSNFIKPGPGQPVTLSWEDARTMFHEFGHALHGLNSAVTYPTLSGTNTTRDFVEFPSQFNENYLSTPQVLKFLVNARGEPIPAELLARIDRARTFNEGFSTAEAQASAIVDMKLHLAGETPIDPKAFEKATLEEIGMPPELVMRHRIPAFGHIFSGDGYAAGYYSYIWAEVLEHDAFEAFTEASGPYDKAVAKRLQETIMSVGNTVDPAQAFRNFRGRDPKPDALLRFKGFPVPAAK